MTFQDFQEKCRYRVPQSFGHYKCRLNVIDTHGIIDSSYNMGPCPRTREDRCLKWKELQTNNRKIRRAIKYWWNDTMRKSWQTLLADPALRDRVFNELVVEIQKELKEPKDADPHHRNRF